MPEVKGDRLYVNLSASQTRRRLKGFGHGVKKVQSAGKNQSVIIHTATGRHFAELKALFSDTPSTSSERELGMPVENLRNLGPTSGKWLRAVGIRTKAELERFGAVPAFLMVREREPRVSLNLLWAIAAALEEKDWRELSGAEKKQLLAELDLE